MRTNQRTNQDIPTCLSSSCYCQWFLIDYSTSTLASFPGLFFFIVTLGRKKGLVSIAWVIVRMRQIQPRIVSTNC